MGCNRPRSVGKPDEYRDDAGRGHAPLTCGRAHPCSSRRVRAERREAVVWHARRHLWQTPTMIPRLHQPWAQAEPRHGSALAAQHTQLLQRRQRLERQSQRFLDAYQTEVISLSA